MESDQILIEIAARTGWDERSCLVLCLQYIENQQSNDTFRDFLLQQEADEQTWPLI